MDASTASSLNALLGRLKRQHVERLLEIADDSLNQFDPANLSTYGKSAESFIASLQREAAMFCNAVRIKVVSLLGNSVIALNDETKAAARIAIQDQLEPSLYSRRLRLQEDSMERRARRMGVDLGARYRIGPHAHARIQAGISTWIARTVSTFESEFETLRRKKAHSAIAVIRQQGAITMPMDDLMTDKIDLLKANGDRIPDLRATVQSGKIFMNAGKIVVEPSDLVVRHMSNGSEETYQVVDPCFFEQFHGIEAHYEMEVRKLGVPEARSAVQSITYNVSGPNARINHGSVDNSTNVVQVDNRLLGHVEQLRKELATADLSEADRADAMEIVDEIESSVRSGSVKRPVVGALLKSLPHVANVTAIVASIAGMLG